MRGHSSCLIVEIWTNRISHLCPMQTENSQPAGKRIMPETKFIEFLALFLDPRVGISQSTSLQWRPMNDYFSDLLFEKS